MGIPHGVFEEGGGFRLVVRGDHAGVAREELVRYSRENSGWPPRDAAPKPISQGIHAAILYAGLIALFYIADHGERLGIDWRGAGRSSAALVRDGEWWRAITALTLHGDLPHLAGNIVFGAAFGIILAQSIGVGFAWWGALVTGAVGNLINAYVQDAGHNSIGASTAVFGLLGIQVAFEWMRRKDLRYRGLRRWAPVFMGIVLWGWLGTGGASIEGTIEDPGSLKRILDKVDVMAHVFGFAVGLAVGVLLGWKRASLRWTPRGHALFAVSVPVVIAIAWFVALRAHAS